MDDITPEEMSNMTEALKNPEFRKLLAEYCNEINDPQNQAMYEQELIQYEAERGVDLTFVTPEPGFVIKTTVDGREKAFINVSRNAKVDRPTSRYACDQDGRRGLQWSIPLTQAPPCRDYDNKKVACVVYDVVFHPDTLHLAGRNREFRQLVIGTACDAVESAFRVRLDRTNLKFPKMAFKGTPRPTVIRKKKSTNCSDQCNRSSDNSDTGDESLADQFYPKVDLNNLNGDRAPTQLRCSSAPAEVAAYAVPQYKLVHRRGVDMQEMTYERDAKLNTTLPQELVITIELPLLKNSQNVKLDVRERNVDLICDHPAKYKLNLALPYAVKDDDGKAQFDSKTRQLVVTLPVNRAAELKLHDLNRVLIKQSSDSGLDSPSPSSSFHSQSSDDDNHSMEVRGVEEATTNFLDEKIAYSLPPFTTNVLDNDVVFTLNVKGVDPQSVEVRDGGQAVGWTHVKFFSIGSGYVPCHYAFYVQFPAGTAIVDQLAEAWDNNVVLQLELKAEEAPQEFNYGVKSWKKGLEKGAFKNNFNSAIVESKTEKEQGDEEHEKIKKETSPQQAFGVKVRENLAKEMTIELSNADETCEDHEDEEGDCDVFHPDEDADEDHESASSQKQSDGTEKQKRKSKGKKKKDKSQQQLQQETKEKKQKNRKGRSLSESHCEDLKQKVEETLKQEKLAAQEKRKAATAVPVAKGIEAQGGHGGVTPGARKGRSVSESGGDLLLDAKGNPFFFKSILKRRFLNRSTSESCSSMDEHGGGGSCSLSFDLGIGSITDIPEEEGDSDHVCGSGKKSVTFNDVIRKQLFRTDASIIGRRMKNLKKRAKKRAQEIRRYSESETSECEDKAHDDDGEEEDEEPEEEEEQDVDDGVAEEAVIEKKKSEQKKKQRGKGATAKGCKKVAGLEFKSEMIFNLEM